MHVSDCSFALSANRMGIGTIFQLITKLLKTEMVEISIWQINKEEHVGFGWWVAGTKLNQLELFM